MSEKLGSILPTILPFGGVRRFLEVGNCFIDRGYEYTIFAKNPTFDGWMNYRGRICDWSEIKADVILIADPPSFPILDRVIGKVYVYVIAGGQYLSAYQEMVGKYPMLLNSRVFSLTFPNARLCEGGVNTSVFTPKAVRVGYYAGRGNIKGEEHIVTSLAGLKNVIPVAIQGLKTPELVEAYKSLDYFVCSELRPGWPNTAVEALACGVPVVSDSLNTSPFSDRVINVKDLREFFKNPMGDFSWEKTCDRLEEIWREDGLLDG